MRVEAISVRDLHEELPWSGLMERKALHRSDTSSGGRQAALGVATKITGQAKVHEPNLV